MPRTRILTWQPGSGERPGRWRKKYKGQLLYLGAGSSKSDHESYQKALANWRGEKKRIDDELASQPKPHQAEYEEAIGDWEKAFRWSQNHGDPTTADRARLKLADLIARLDQKSPPPLEYGDRFWDTFEIPDPIREELAAIAEIRAVSLGIKSASPPGDNSTSAKRILPSSPILSPMSFRRELWKDRLGHEDASVEETSNHLSVHIDNYLRKERLRVDTGGLSAGRFSAKRNNLLRFLDWAGKTTSIEAINGAMVQNFHSELLNQIGRKELAPDTAHGRLGEVSSFIRWLWQTEVLAELPRILARKSNDLNIGTRVVTPEVFSLDEIKLMLTSANDRLRLYLLLMLNCGMYQSDVSDLRQEEVDWQVGTVTRKRSKTKFHANVPKVRYRLWPETLRLLKQFREPKGDRVLLNTNGNPLVHRGLKPDGKPTVNDAIKNAYDRLRKATKITKPMKHLRKTSATLISGNANYRGLEELFLGHSPKSMSDRHYSQPPEQLLAEATEWLRGEYRVG